MVRGEKAAVRGAVGGDAEGDGGGGVRCVVAFWWFVGEALWLLRCYIDISCMYCVNDQGASVKDQDRIRARLVRPIPR